MIPNTNDGSQAEPRLRCDLNLGNLNDLPDFSQAPTGEPKDVYAALKEAGFEGLQGGDVALCNELGLGVTGGGRINTPEEVPDMAKQHQDNGWEAATYHVGWGMESDAQIDAILDAIITASSKLNFPMYIETHRATITQDIYRTVSFVERFPEIRFNGDFSHWYTGLEMVYGDIDGKFDFLQPVFDRVRFLHARIGNPGNIQVDIGDGTNRPYVDHFREMWTRSFAGFLKTAKPGDFISFNPELLQPSIYYARVFPDANGNLVEEGDRWQQALLYTEIAKSCFEEARKRLAG